MSQPFRFKEFTVQQDRCAMQIGTDGVLLGAWVSLETEPQSILDIGTGTGLIALQLAQRSLAETIEAVEIDAAAYEQCTENFEASPWGDRLFCYHASIQEFASTFAQASEDESEVDEQYNLIVSNPPFYEPAMPSTSHPDGANSISEARQLARFTDALPFQHLVVCAAHLLSEDGIFAIIIPKKEEENLKALAAASGLFPKRICEVRGTDSSEVKRCLMEFSFEKQAPKQETLTIEISRHNYTEAYTELVKDFYLKL